MARLFLAIWTLALAALPASAQPFPNRPITLVVSFAPGGSASRPTGRRLPTGTKRVSAWIRAPRSCPGA